MTLRMLAEGRSDAASAKRMGVSTRTFATYISMLKEEMGVETRYQLGYALGRLSETADADELDDAVGVRRGGVRLRPLSCSGPGHYLYP